MRAAGVVTDRRGRADRPRARRLPRLDDRRAAAGSPRGLDEAIAGVGGIIEKSAPVNDVVNDDQRAARRRRRPARGPARQEGRRSRAFDAVGLVDGLYPGAAAAGLRNFPEQREIKAPRIAEVYTQGHAHARAARPRGADRRRQPERPGAAQRRGRQPAARLLYPELRQSRPESAAALAGDRHRRAGAVRAARRHRRSAQAAARRRRYLSLRRERSMQTPAPFEYERATSVDGAIASLQRLGPEARDHRRRPQPAADDEAAAREPRAPDRHQRPRELAYIREQGDEIRIGALTRHVDLLEVRAARRALAGLPRRRAGDRRPGRAQPRHDRRLALPGRRGRGPLGRLRGGQGERRDPRRRRRARRSGWTTSTSART